MIFSILAFTFAGGIFSSCSSCITTGWTAPSWYLQQQQTAAAAAAKHQQQEQDRVLKTHINQRVLQG
jgi:hypothetical protein